MAERIMARSGGESRELTLEVVNTLLAVVEEKDPHLRQHCERVANSCTHFCEKFSLLPPKEIDVLYFACLLHDLGLMFGPADAGSMAEKPATASAALKSIHPRRKWLAGMSPPQVPAAHPPPPRGLGRQRLSDLKGERFAGCAADLPFRLFRRLTTRHSRGKAWTRGPRGDHQMSGSVDSS
jgi:hypothetical protein